MCIIFEKQSSDSLYFWVAKMKTKNEPKTTIEIVGNAPWPPTIRTRLTDVLSTRKNTSSTLNKKADSGWTYKRVIYLLGFLRQIQSRISDRMKRGSCLEFDYFWRSKAQNMRNSALGTVCSFGGNAHFYTAIILWKLDKATWIFSILSIRIQFQLLISIGIGYKHGCDKIGGGGVRLGIRCWAMSVPPREIIYREKARPRPDHTCWRSG